MTPLQHWRRQSLPSSRKNDAGRLRGVRAKFRQSFSQRSVFRDRASRKTHQFAVFYTTRFKGKLGEILINRRSLANRQFEGRLFAARPLLKILPLSRLHPTASLKGGLSKNNSGLCRLYRKVATICQVHLLRRKVQAKMKGESEKAKRGENVSSSFFPSAPFFRFQCALNRFFRLVLFTTV